MEGLDWRFTVVPPEQVMLVFAVPADRRWRSLT